MNVKDAVAILRIVEACQGHFHECTHSMITSRIHMRHGRVWEILSWLLARSLIELDGIDYSLTDEGRIYLGRNEEGGSPCPRL